MGEAASRRNAANTLCLCLVLLLIISIITHHDVLIFQQNTESLFVVAFQPPIIILQPPKRRYKHYWQTTFVAKTTKRNILLTRRNEKNDDNVLSNSQSLRHQQLVVGDQVVMYNNANANNDDDDYYLQWSENQALNQMRKSFFQKLEWKISSLAQEYGDDNIKLMMRRDSHLFPERAIRIKSILFSCTSSNANDEEYILVILPTLHRVDTTKLLTYLQKQQRVNNNDNIKIEMVSPATKVEEICGFPPKSVPPFDVTNDKKLNIIVDSQLYIHQQQQLEEEEEENVMLLTGAGHAEMVCIVSLDTLLSIDGYQVADVSNKMVQTSTTKNNVASSLQLLKNNIIMDSEKPYFPIEPYDRNVILSAFQLQQNKNNKIKDDNSTCAWDNNFLLRPKNITLVGRISGVRKVSSRLTFVDFEPPNHVVVDNNNDNQLMDRFSWKSWRSVTDGMEMSVQLIAGKTLFDTLDNDDDKGKAAIKALRPGHLIFVKARTSTTKQSLDAWIQRQSFHLVICDYQILGEWYPPSQAIPTVRMEREYRNYIHQLTTVDNDNNNVKATVPLILNGNEKPNNVQQEQTVPTNPSIEKGNTETTTTPQETKSTTTRTMDAFPNNKTFEHLNMSHIYPDGDARILQVHDLESIQEFSSLVKTTIDDNNLELVGIDAEWKPSFFGTYRELYPVLLLQMCFHSAKTIVLVDAQALLRPCLNHSMPMNEKEAALSDVLMQVFMSRQFIKVGFLLTCDLRRLGSSYPHMECFFRFEAVVEVGKVARDAVEMAKLGVTREEIASLSKLSQFLLHKTMKKNEQVSNWSCRPLSPSQIEYASLDAAVLPIMLERALGLVNATLILDDGIPRMERWSGDAALATNIASLCLIFLDPYNRYAIQKLRAVRLVGNTPIVSQRWVTGTTAPDLPSIPSRDEPYTDMNGELRVPPSIVELDLPNRAKHLAGVKLKKSKASCLEVLVEGSENMPAKGSIDFETKAGYVEFKDSIVIFVNMPEKYGETDFDRSNYKYLNEWSNNGKCLTWFLKHSDWEQGSSSIAQKMLQSAPAILFIRPGRGRYVCCGLCQVVPHQEKGQHLIKFYLHLQDWDALQTSPEFKKMTIFDPDEVTPVDLVLSGNTIGAMHQAFEDARVPMTERSIREGVDLLQSIFSKMNNARSMAAAARLEESVNAFY